MSPQVRIASSSHYLPSSREGKIGSLDYIDPPSHLASSLQYQSVHPSSPHDSSSKDFQLEYHKQVQHDKISIISVVKGTKGKKGAVKFLCFLDRLSSNNHDMNLSMGLVVGQILCREGKKNNRKLSKKEPRVSKGNLHI